MNQDIFDVLIVGAGIIGLSVARELSRYKLKVGVIEKACDVASFTTKANSGIVHAGYAEDPKTLRGKYTAQGNKLLGEWCEELEVPFKRTGSLVVGLKKEDLTVLEELRERAKFCGVLGTRIIKREEILSLLPHITPKVWWGFYAPTAGIISPYELGIALFENARANGVRFFFNTRVDSLKKEGEIFLVGGGRKFWKTKFLINAAGLWADELTQLLGEREFNITPRKGEYLIFDKLAGYLASLVIFPLPTPVSKGVTFTPTVEGNILSGPNAYEVKDKEDFSTTRKGLEEVFLSNQELFPSLSLRWVISSFAGLRAVAEGNDFIIGPSPQAKGFINVAGIQSPGLTAAPRIAREVVEILREEGLSLKKKSHFNPYRKRIIPFREIGWEERKILIRKDSKYAHIVCRCETVSEKEVVEAIERGATTLDGVKFRVRCGMGRCQGGFCTPRVLEILSRELGVLPQRLTKRGRGSWLVIPR